MADVNHRVVPNHGPRMFPMGVIVLHRRLRSAIQVAPAGLRPRIRACACAVIAGAGGAE